MTAIGIGLRRNETENDGTFSAAAAGSSSKDQIATLLAKFVKWIPADVVAGYSAFVASNWVLQTAHHEGDPAKHPAPTPSWALFWIALACCPFLVLLGGWLANEMPKVVRRIIFACAGYVIWTAAVPHSVWERAEWFKDRDAAPQGFVLLILGGALALVGEKVLKAGALGNGTGWKRFV